MEKNSPASRKRRSENDGTDDDPTGTQKVEREMSTKITWELILLRAFKHLNLDREQRVQGAYVWWMRGVFTHEMSLSCSGLFQ